MKQNDSVQLTSVW